MECLCFISFIQEEKAAREEEEKNKTNDESIEDESKTQEVMKRFKNLICWYCYWICPILYHSIGQEDFKKNTDVHTYKCRPIARTDGGFVVLNLHYLAYQTASGCEVLKLHLF